MNVMIAPLIAASVTAAGAPPSATAFYADTFARRPSVDELTSIGRALFVDRSLSASGRLACATCHDPAHAFGPPPAIDGPVALGGADGRTPGLRAVPSLRYLQQAPRFELHYQDSDGDGADQGPAGGLTWDGRVGSAHDQARAPLFSPFEMANASEAELVARVRRGPEAAAMRAAFGADVLDRDALAMKAILWSLEVYQQTPADFAPYTSKFDDVLRGRATLSAQEARGLALFEDPAKGNCASCHPDRPKDGAFPLFTDFGMVALGVPRNRAIAANRDPAFFDLGLCGPLRTDLAGRADLCGRFRTPSLRNVATRRRFMHNGAFTSLAEVVRFYATRDVTPARWYPRGVPDDLPAAYRDHLERGAPFGATRRLSDQDVADLVAFLGTLTDR
jgi:cytochrome c peroxidase